MIVPVNDTSKVSIFSPRAVVGPHYNSTTQRRSSQVGGRAELSFLFAFLFLFLFWFFILNLPASLTLPFGRAWLWSGY
jgi:hypothetical protein